MGLPLVSFLAVANAPGFLFMELREIFIQYCAHLRDNFYPVEDPALATLMPTTGDLISEIEQHYGELGNEDNPIDKSVFVEQMRELGFTFIMLPGTTELRWLLAEKQ